MSLEMRVFVSLIVWLFSITGRDGLQNVRPSNFVALKGSTLTILCDSDSDYPVWKAKKFLHPDTILLVKNGCVSGQSRDYTVSKYEEDSYFHCDLIVNPTALVFSDRLSTMLTCEEDTDGVIGNTASAILIVLRAPLKCGMKEKGLACVLLHSAFRNTSMMLQYVDIRLELKNPKGAVVSSKTAGYMDDKTIVTTALDGEINTANQYSCSAIFKAQCYSIVADKCVSELTVTPPTAAECKCEASELVIVDDPDPSNAIESPQVKERIEEEMAKLDNGTSKIRRPGSNAKLERDGIDAIAMLTCLLVAFLVH